MCARHFTCLSNFISFEPLLLSPSETACPTCLPTIAPPYYSLYLSVSHTPPVFYLFSLSSFLNSPFANISWNALMVNPCEWKGKSYEHFSNGLCVGKSFMFCFLKVFCFYNCTRTRLKDGDARSPSSWKVKLSSNCLKSFLILLGETRISWMHFTKNR